MFLRFDCYHSQESLEGVLDMMSKQRKVSDKLAFGDKAKLQIRYTFTAQFLMAAGMHARLAAEFERKKPEQVDEADRVAHRGYVVSAIMQSVASLESEIWQVMTYGPGHHLGSNGVDLKARTFLEPIVQSIERLEVLQKYKLVLHLLQKEPLPPAPWNNARIAVKLRNEIVHYKSKWDEEFERGKLFRSLQGLKHRKPPFLPSGKNLYFPLPEC